MAKGFMASKLGGKGKKKAVVVRDSVFLGKGSEKEVHDVSVRVTRGDRSRVRRFALKKYASIDTHSHSWSNPKQQVKNYNALKKLNTEKKLGLTLIPTFRLLHAPCKTPGVLATRLYTFHKSFLNSASFPEEVKERIFSEIRRQVDIVKENGFTIGPDAFVLTQVDKKIVPVIADFKFVHPRLSKERIAEHTAGAEAHARKRLSN